MKELFQLTTVPSSGASSGSGSSGESNKSDQDTGSPKVQVLKSKNWKKIIPNSVPFWLKFIYHSVPVGHKRGKKLSELLV